HRAAENGPARPASPGSPDERARATPRAPVQHPGAVSALPTCWICRSGRCHGEVVPTRCDAQPLPCNPFRATLAVLLVKRGAWRAADRRDVPTSPEDDYHPEWIHATIDRRW